MRDRVADPFAADVDPSLSPETKANAAILKLALERFKLVADGEREQRALELEDLRFEEGDQWPEDIKTARQGGRDGGSAPRPCLTLNKLKAPIRQVTNQQRTAKLAHQINPLSGAATQDTAEVFQGLMRHIDVQSRGPLARGWAFDRAVKAGRGFYRILTQYANDGDFDLDIVIARILNQASVYLDPFATEPDWSDGEWALITEDVPARRYKREHPKSKLAIAGSSSDLDSLGDTPDGWIRSSGPEGETYRIAEYFYVDFTEHTLVVTEAGWKGTEDEYEALPDRLRRAIGLIVQSRTVVDRQVKWCKLNAVEILDQSDWDGRYIPIIPVLGDEYYIDGKRIWKGVVRDAKDAQRSYNYMRSTEVETIGLTPKAPYIAAEGQLEGKEAQWSQANVKNFAWLEYKPISIAGLAVPPPQRNVVEPAVQAVTQAAREADNDIKATTGVGDPSLGQYSPQDRSGKAIQALQRQSEHGNSNYLDALAVCSMTYEGRVLLDLIPHVYDRPGRVARILGEDQSARTVMLNQPFVLDAQGQPQAAAVDDQGASIDPAAKTYDLSAGAYGVTVSVGKSYQTRRQEGVDLMGELFKANPAAAPLFLDLWLAEMDFPGARAMSARAKKMLPPPLQEGAEGDPAAAAQQLTEAQQQLQQMQQQLMEAQQTIATKQIEIEAKANIELAKLTAKAETDRLQIESKERIARIEADVELARTQATLGEARRKTDVTAAAARHKTDVEAGSQAARQEAELRARDRDATLQRGHEAALAGAQAGEAAAARAHDQVTTLS